MLNKSYIIAVSHVCVCVCLFFVVLFFIAVCIVLVCFVVCLAYCVHYIVNIDHMRNNVCLYSDFVVLTVLVVIVCLCFFESGARQSPTVHKRNISRVLSIIRH